MNKLVVLIGLPASGKSTIAKDMSEEYGYVIHSSDELRLGLFGSYEIQDKNDELFKELHKRILLDLKSGKDVIFDATNLSMKKRKHFLSMIPKYVFKEALVVATELSVCIEKDKLRERSVGEGTIRRMLTRFQFPLQQEGFDSIDVVYPYRVDFKNNYSNMRILTSDFDQKNKYHSLHLRDHMLIAFEKSKEMGLKYDISRALLLHDIGKLETQTFKNSKGLPSEDAHYYGHEGASAYMSLFMVDKQEGSSFYDIQLIQYHMLPYSLETEKSSNKWFNFLGETMYVDLMQMNACDRLAH